jgi:hypothetical protein
LTTFRPDKVFIGRFVTDFAPSESESSPKSDISPDSSVLSLSSLALFRFVPALAFPALGVTFAFVTVARPGAGIEATAPLPLLVGVKDPAFALGGADFAPLLVPLCDMTASKSIFSVVFIPCNTLLLTDSYPGGCMPPSVPSPRAALGFKGPPSRILLRIISVAAENFVSKGREPVFSKSTDGLDVLGAVAPGLLPFATTPAFAIVGAVVMGKEVLDTYSREVVTGFAAIGRATRDVVHGELEADCDITKFVASYCSDQSCSTERRWNRTVVLRKILSGFYAIDA